MRKITTRSVDEQLGEIASRKASGKKWKRAAVVLSHCKGASIHRAALEVGVSWRAARNWVRSFKNGGIDALMVETRGRRAPKLRWSASERAMLRRLAAEHSHRNRQTEARHVATVGLLLAEGYSVQEIARSFRPRWRTQRVERWRARFIAKRLACIPARWLWSVASAR